MRTSDRNPPRSHRALLAWLLAVALAVGAGAVGFAAAEPVDASTPVGASAPVIDDAEVEGYQRRTWIDLEAATAATVPAPTGAPTPSRSAAPADRSALTAPDPGATDRDQARAPPDLR